MNIIYLLDLLGTFTFAISGVLSASRQKFDIFGAFFIAFVTAVGGGTVRDLILNQHPIFWLKQPAYFITIAAAVLITLIFIKRMMHVKNMLLFFDAVGIGVFTVIGLHKALSIGISPIFCIMMGMITAVMGGMLRDIFSRQVPVVLRQEIYATACIAGGGIYFILRATGLGENWTVAATILCIIVARLISLKYHISLPKLSYQDP